MTTNKIPFAALWRVIDYLQEDELRHYCDGLCASDDSGHVYETVIELLEWLATTPKQAGRAREYLEYARTEIAAAKEQAEEAA